MGVSIGTLIIGSLYWDPEPNRARWRSERLDLAASRNVFAPIRYGRRSDSRGNSYTMVFSEALTRQEPHMGCAIAIPCARPVHSIQALVEEAQHLWAAERTRDSFNGRISADWGRIALALIHRVAFLRSWLMAGPIVSSKKSATVVCAELRTRVR